LTGTDLVKVLRARARPLSQEQAQLLATMMEVGLCDPHTGPDEVARLAQAPEYDADKVRAALAWTHNAASREYHLAELTDEQIQEVCERLLPDAARLTTGELAARITKLGIAPDPEWAARRYASAVQDRDVIGYLDADGTATVTGRRLPAEQAAAACARIEDLAKAAKRTGHPGRIGPLRADIYVGPLEGRWQQLTRDQIIADLLAHATPADRSTWAIVTRTPRRRGRRRVSRSQRFGLRCLLMMISALTAHERGKETGRPPGGKRWGSSTDGRPAFQGATSSPRADRPSSPTAVAELGILHEQRQGDTPQHGWTRCPGYVAEGDGHQLAIRR
jgi:hypothetical protein